MEAQRITFGPQLIATIPQILGYVPCDSLVLATASTTANPREGRMGPCLRLDFAPRDVHRLGPATAQWCADRLHELDGIDTIFPVVFSEAIARFHLAWDEADPDAEDELEDVAAAADALERVCSALRNRGLTVFTPLWSGSGASGAHLRPEETDPAADAGIAARSGDAAVAASFEECVRTRIADPVTLASVDALRCEEYDEREIADALLAEALLLDGRARTCEAGEALDGSVVVDPLAALAVEMLCRRGRDRDIVQLLLSGDHPDFDPALLRMLGPGEFLGYARVILADGAAAAGVVGLSDVPPRHAALAEAVDWLRTCAELVDPRARADVLALVAWFEWARGRMSFAQHFAERAVDQQEGHGMAGMLVRAVEEGLPPRWMRGDAGEP